MGLSPAAFSERIRRLEEGLGTSLLERSARRVALTRAGRELLPHALACLAAARACQHSASKGTPPPVTLTLGTRHELGMSWLLPALDSLHEERPRRQIHLAFGSGPDLTDHLNDGQLDGAISSVRLLVPGLEAVTLHPEDYAFVATPALLRARPLDGPEDARAHTLLDSNPTLPLFRYFHDAWPDAEAWRFGSCSCLGTIAAIHHRLLRDAGVAVLPRYFVAADLADGRLVEVLPRVQPFSDAFRLVWRRGHPESRELEVLGRELARFPLC